MWGLIRHCRRSQADPGGDVGFLDHPEVYDGFGDPPRLLAPTAVAEIAHSLDAIDLGTLLADLPDSPADAAAACGFGPGFNDDVRAHLAEHFGATREFYREAATGRPPRNP